MPCQLIKNYCASNQILIFSSSILEVEEESYTERSEASSNTLTVRHTENTFHFKYDLSTINQINERRDSEVTYRLDLEQRDDEQDSMLAFCPIEVYERNFLRNLQQQKEQQQNEPGSSSTMNRREDNTTVSNCLQIPIISVPNVMEKPPPAPLAMENIYTSENMTIIDTDVPVRLRVKSTSSHTILIEKSF